MLFSCNPVITTYYRKYIGICQYEAEGSHKAWVGEKKPYHRVH
jgi:hypothetical protein